MNRTLAIALIGVLSIVARKGDAAVFERDWQAPGDGLLTFDDVNKREWLDLSQTLLSDQFPGGPPVFPGPRERRYQYVAGQTGPGGLFEGFTVAKSQDAAALANSAGIAHTTFDFAANAAPTSVLIQLLGSTHEFSATGSKLAIGLIDELDVRFSRLSANYFVYPTSGANGQAGLRLGQSHTEFIAPPGVMLYRNAVPEPSTWIFFLMFSSALAARKYLFYIC